MASQPMHRRARRSFGFIVLAFALGTLICALQALNQAGELESRLGLSINTDKPTAFALQFLLVVLCAVVLFERVTYFVSQYPQFHAQMLRFLKMTWLVGIALLAMLISAITYVSAVGNLDWTTGALIYSLSIMLGGAGSSTGAYLLRNRFTR